MVLQGFRLETLEHPCSHARRCPGSVQAMAASSGRRTLTAFALYDGMMRAVGGAADDEADQAMLENAEGMSPAVLLGGQEPSAAEEELWFAERNRWGQRGS